jgi:hypothetical protein
MPRYFFTTASERLVVEDTEGSDLPGIGALHDMARATLGHMFEEEAGREGGLQRFSVSARDEDGNEVLSATLALSVQFPPNA